MAGLFATFEGVAGGAVVVVAGPVDEHLVGATAAGPTFEVAPGRFLLRLPNGLRFLVADGSHVTYHRPPGLVSRDVALFLMGSVWAAVAYQRGLLPLHMSGIERDGAVGDIVEGSKTTYGSEAARVCMERIVATMRFARGAHDQGRAEASVTLEVTPRR